MATTHDVESTDAEVKNLNLTTLPSTSVNVAKAVTGIDNRDTTAAKVGNTKPFNDSLTAWLITSGDDRVIFQLEFNENIIKNQLPFELSKMHHDAQISLLGHLKDLKAYLDKVKAAHEETHEPLSKVAILLWRKIKLVPIGYRFTDKEWRNIKNICSEAVRLIVKSKRPEVSLDELYRKFMKFGFNFDPQHYSSTAIPNAILSSAEVFYYAADYNESVPCMKVLIKVLEVLEKLINSLC